MNYIREIIEDIHAMLITALERSRAERIEKTESKNWRNTDER